MRLPCYGKDTINNSEKGDKKPTSSVKEKISFF